MTMPKGPGTGNDIDRWRMPSYPETEPRWVFGQTDRTNMATAAASALICLNNVYSGQTSNFSDYNNIPLLLSSLAPLYKITPPFMDNYPPGYVPSSME